jgi:dynein heavy chain
MDGHWIPFLKGLKSPIPVTEGLDPLSLLTDDAQVPSLLLIAHLLEELTLVS